MIEDQGYAVFGGGGHGKVVADALLSMGFRLLGFVDDGLVVGTTVLTQRGLSLCVLGKGPWLVENRSHVLGVALGIGHNGARRHIAQVISDQGLPIATVVHPTAVVSQFAVVEQGAVLMAGAVVNPSARVGAGAIVNTGAIVEHDAVVGEFSHVSPNATLTGAARLGALSQLGAGGVVLAGISVGRDCTVGAGAVVNRDVPDCTVVAGVPARRMGGGAA